MRIAVIGLGQMGKIYVSTLLNLGFSQEEIVGIDIRLDRLSEITKKWSEIKSQSSLETADLEGVDIAIVATNTPSHHRVILDLLRKSVKNIFCEKPLGINLQTVEEIEKGLELYGGMICTAFLINFSEAVSKVRKMMVEENLYLAEGYVNWGKDRTNNNRPTPGDLEDESVHGIGVIHFLMNINQKVKNVSVFGKLSHLPYVNRDAQKKACELDESFPSTPNSSSFITEVITADRGDVVVGIHSSFVNIRQERSVHVTLCDAKTGEPKYLAMMEFDTPAGDIVSIKKVGSNEDIRKEVFFEDKVALETKAFIEAAMHGVIDFRSTKFETAKLAVEFSDAVVKSNKTGKIVRI